MVRSLYRYGLISRRGRYGEEAGEAQKPERERMYWDLKRERKRKWKPTFKFRAWG